ncbi:CsgG/HfaB family protein [Candidatus Aminicenantes bacterium AC-708-M15]|jgi:curli biogenesis system outer membrane secretion channel CsgG|nr:CsgG/HfaB family protein [SCandidatus Aminicenantes bacterium Aminicenantia_JdfR_composite]MCP2598824.1 CsgG/HfaB family protein [Candidatus Aminicenantes bacterium AC-335-L06]MCP2604445.1 CsgG/HfaB family protein [Candidatus Aminicenantes bacterium AC-708-M15]MCP2619139.1 CsgG/HfaB family protein [Candidatus Aminicenantes bacterium AC-335-A11]MCP2621227.1 CsgG/HfaB family protein [Candidatus Aminicenantes bacterium AC-334-E05]
MKKVYFGIGFLIILLLIFSGCVSTTVTSTGGPTIQEAQTEPYNGPKARIAVLDFKDKTRKTGWVGGWMQMWGVEWSQVGEGMRDMLTTALFNTNRFIVLERELLDEVLREQDLGATGRVKKGTEAKKGELYGADLLITGAVTEFQATQSGGGLATRLAGITLGGGIKRAHVAIDIRIIDANTGQIVAATSVEGKATDVGGLILGKIGLPVGLGAFAKTPIEKAIRACIQRAVEFIVNRTPPQYYRY